MTFLQELSQQRFDDHRYYHHNRINQALHLISACCFLASYVMIFIDPVIAVMVGWMLAMILRQIGHFFFEPKSFDNANGVSHEYKESVKVGYNLHRKVVLLSVWVAIPVVMLVKPDFFGLMTPHQNVQEFLYNLSIAWLSIGIGAVIVRTIHLFKLMSVQSGLVWFTKILTDPFHDIKIYHKAPYYILKGELYDDCEHWYDASVSRVNH